MITVFSTKDCPKCEELKRALNELRIEFESQDMASAEALTQLRVDGIFTLSAPVLYVDGDYYLCDDLFENGMLIDVVQLVS